MGYWWIHTAPWAQRPGLAAFVLFAGALFSRTTVFWTIERQGRPIGHCHIRHIDRSGGHGTAAILIGDKRAQGMGLGVEALALRNAYAFQRLGLDRIEVSVAAKNLASRRLVERSGYRLIGVAKEDAYLDGQKSAVLLFELLRSDWTGARLLDERPIGSAIEVAVLGAESPRRLA